KVVVVAEVAVRPLDAVEIEIPVVARVDPADDRGSEVVVGVVDLGARPRAGNLAEQPGIRLDAPHELADGLAETLHAVPAPRPPVDIEPPPVDIELAHPVSDHIEQMRLEIVVIPVQIRQVPEAVVLA